MALGLRLTTLAYSLPKLDWSIFSRYFLIFPGGSFCNRPLPPSPRDVCLFKTNDWPMKKTITSTTKRPITPHHWPSSHSEFKMNLIAPSLANNNRGCDEGIVIFVWEKLRRLLANNNKHKRLAATITIIRHGDCVTTTTPSSWEEGYHPTEMVLPSVRIQCQRWYAVSCIKSTLYLIWSVHEQCGSHQKYGQCYWFI